MIVQAVVNARHVGRRTTRPPGWRVGQLTAVGVGLALMDPTALLAQGAAAASTPTLAAVAKSVADRDNAALTPVTATAAQQRARGAATHTLEPAGVGAG